MFGFVGRFLDLLIGFSCAEVDSYDSKQTQHDGLVKEHKEDFLVASVLP